MSSNIRNFAIIAHIDHGKSTLSDRFLEITGTVSKNQLQDQYLDQNPVSRERGITIKLAPVRMNYKKGNTEYILNLIDTPGHVDFSYEVSRTLAACEGVILLVDATQGIQAQTVAHFNSAKKENLKIIPVINKIDLPTAKIAETETELYEIFGFKKEEIIHVSAKSGKNVENLLDGVIERIPPPSDNSQKSLRALVFDAFYDEHRGVVVYVRIVDGKLSLGEGIVFLHSQKLTKALEVGYFKPFLDKKESINNGEIGYIVTGIKDIHLAQVGDTVTISNIKNQISNFKPLPGYKKPKPMVFFGLYPRSTSDLVHLKEGLFKYSLNDTSISITSEYSSFLGSGFKVGFLGLLHADIVRQRLKNEENLDVILTSPQVIYETKENGQIYEPYMDLTIFSPASYVGRVITICQKRKGTLIDLTYFQETAIFKYEMPYGVLIKGLSSELKSATSGFASIDYEVTNYRSADLVKMDIKINSVLIDILSEYVYRDELQKTGREKAEKLKKVLPKKQIRQIIQAVAGDRIISRTEIPPFRKDVIAGLYGGDRTRKDKLLEAQKKGKAKMLDVAKIDIPQDALFSLIEK
ncbi:MAG: elongation factor 4 [Candidatus Levybacteria bacterium RIFCSPLOWO2_01_FULL_39_10]|nr:MAG: elongation factor 4 [Candidatus Levybacteria bacterium RIFCSPLOWO2_01_FULL_39_10]